MNFISKIYNKKGDDEAHLQFQKFSKGEFNGRALIRVKKTAKNYNISTTFEFARELINVAAQKLAEDKANVKGAIVSTEDLTGEIDFKEKKQFQGVKRYIIDKEMSGEEIIQLLGKFPTAFFGLSFEVGYNKLKIKPKAPKSAKPSTKGGKKPIPGFCRFVTTDRNMVNDFVFEKSDFKIAEISHDFLIEEIILPKGEKDFAKMRELAKRKGRIIRTAEIDGEVLKEEIGFVI